jgi:hypothetical protein
MITILGFSVKLEDEGLKQLSLSQLTDRANFAFNFKTDVEYAQERSMLRNAVMMCGIKSMIMVRNMDEGENFNITDLKSFINNSKSSTYKKILDIEQL